MDIEIVTRQQIAERAELEAARSLQDGRREPVNPYPIGSDAHAAFEASLVRYLHECAVPESEASA
jgi:hypothetical protein